jgi:hypothetical protein
MVHPPGLLFRPRSIKYVAAQKMVFTEHTASYVSEMAKLFLKN